MTKVVIRNLAEAPIVDPLVWATGLVKTSALLDREDQPIHLHVHRLEPGASMQFEAAPTEIATYVWKGAVYSGGVRLDKGSSVIVEFGGAVSLKAGEEGAQLVTYSLARPSPQPRAGGHVHLLPAENVPRVERFDADPRVGGGLHADARCPTCELWLHDSTFHVPDTTVAIHAHAQDEIIFITGGIICFSGRNYGEGTAIAIAAYTNYGFSSGSEGLTFLNFHSSSPTSVVAETGQFMDEGEFWRQNLAHNLKYFEPYPE